MMVVVLKYALYLLQVLLILFTLHSLRVLYWLLTSKQLSIRKDVVYGGLLTSWFRCCQRIESLFYDVLKRNSYHYVGGCKVYIADIKVTRQKKLIELLGLIDLHLQYQCMSKQRQQQSSASNLETMVCKDAYTEFLCLLKSNVSLADVFQSYEQLYLMSIRWCSNLQDSYNCYQPLFYLHQPETK